MAQEFKNILVPIDFSEDAEKATEAAITLFGDRAETIALLTVCESMVNRHAEMISEVYSIMTDLVKEKIQDFAKKYTEKHAGIKAFIKKGHAAQEILTFAKENETDLIIMGSQGRGSIARVFFGSTTYDVSRKSPCSIFVIKS